jgi:hypothetical protein
MIFIDLPIRSDVSLVAPADSCCNCGSTTNVKAEPTDLRRMPLMGFAGAEIKVTLPFPYCEACSATARRKRPNALGIIAVSALLALVLGMAWLFLGPQTSEDTTLYVVAPALIVTELRGRTQIPSSWFSRRRAVASRDSSYGSFLRTSTG